VVVVCCAVITSSPVARRRVRTMVDPSTDAALTAP
jgi:hypothetical protein